MTTLTNIADYIVCNPNLVLLWLTIASLASLCVLASSMWLKMAQKHRELDRRYRHVRQSREELYKEHQKQPKRDVNGKYKQALMGGKRK